MAGWKWEGGGEKMVGSGVRRLRGRLAASASVFFYKQDNIQEKTTQETNYIWASRWWRRPGWKCLIKLWDLAAEPKQVGGKHVNVIATALHHRGLHQSFIFFLMYLFFLQHVTSAGDLQGDDDETDPPLNPVLSCVHTLAAFLQHTHHAHDI